jgi:uncharacterized protein (UPF0548 family)
VFLMHRPSRLEIERFIERSADTPLSYEPIGLAGADHVWGNVDELNTVVGCGEADFERARAALAAWKQFDMSWVELHSREASQNAGTTIAILVHHFGFWSLNGARVVYGIGDRHLGDRFGLGYGTLTNHAERGEERFEVSLSRESGAVTYRLRAVSSPRAALARVGYPLTRHLQARFRRDSAEAMRRATRSGGQP